jgi:hypothetical protein
MCLFPIVTVLRDDGIYTKILFAIIVATQVWMMFEKPMRRNSVLLLVLLVVHYLFVLSQTFFPVSNINLLFYYPFFLFYTYFICENLDRLINWLQNNKTFITLIVTIWSLIVGISVFLPSCYYVKEGGASYFGSFCGSIFRLGPSALFIQVLALILQCFHKQRSAILYSILPMYSYFMGSSRTYLVIGLCVFVISWYVFCKKPKKFWKSIVPMAGVLLVILGATSMIEKIKYTLDPENYGDFWFRITSSRSVLWQNIFEAWEQTNFGSKLFGNDIAFTINEAGNWAHNDFLEILCSFGILGLATYLLAIKRLTNIAYRDSVIPRIIKICAFMTWIFNAFFNMHYVYFCAVLCYPLLLATIGSHFGEKKRYYLERQ